MTADIVLDAAAWVSALVFTAHVWTGTVLLISRPPTAWITITGRARGAANRMWWLTKWPALAGLGIIWFDGVDAGVTPTYNAIFLLIGSAIWWMVRNAGDDDFRKRRREALHARVAAIAGRLTIVAVPEGANP